MTDWSQIVEEHGAMVWKTIERLLGHEADTADCFQRTFIAAWELSRAEPVRHWPALLRRLATARAIECLRARMRDRHRRENLANSSAVGRQPVPPHAAAQLSELTEHLRQALAQIDERQAQVFCLACLDHCSYDEIAEQLDVTANHVGVLLSRAKAALRDRLRQYQPKAKTSKATGHSNDVG